MTEKLRRLKENAEALDGTQSVSLPELMPPSFIDEHTEYADLGAFMDASGLFDGADTAKAAETLKTPEWDAWVKSKTRFDSWSAMVKTAGVEHVKRQLFKGVK